MLQLAHSHSSNALIILSIGSIIPVHFGQLLAILSKEVSISLGLTQT